MIKNILKKHTTFGNSLGIIKEGNFFLSGAD